MAEFKNYRKKALTEMRPVSEADIRAFRSDRREAHSMRDHEFKVSISETDIASGSPKFGDMIARNSDNHDDQWLIAKEYFDENYEPTK